MDPKLHSCTVPINQLRISLALTVYIVYSCYVFLKKKVNQVSSLRFYILGHKKKG